MNIIIIIQTNKQTKKPVDIHVSLHYFGEHIGSMEIKLNT